MSSPPASNDTYDVIHQNASLKTEIETLRSMLHARRKELQMLSASPQFRETNFDMKERLIEECILSSLFDPSTNSFPEEFALSRLRNSKIKDTHSLPVSGLARAISAQMPVPTKSMRPNTTTAPSSSLSASRPPFRPSSKYA